MGSASPPRRMTRARAAAASATAAALGASSTKVTKSSKSSKAAATSAKKAVTTAAATAAKKASTAAATAAKKPATAAKKAAATTAAKKAAATTTAAKKSATARKTIAAKKPTAKKTTKAAASSATTTTRPTTGKRKVRTFDSDDDEDDLSKEDSPQPTMNRPAKKLRGSAKKAVDPEPDSESEHEFEPQPNAQEQDAQPSITTTIVTRSTRGRSKQFAPTTAALTTATSFATATATLSPPQTQSSSTITRQRTRKGAVKDDDATTTAKQAPKKRGRPAAAAGTITTTYTTEPTPGLKSAVSRPTSKMAGVLKKTVTFQEPEKENMPPAATTKAKAKADTTANTATGMRARPVRKPAAPGRTTRASTRAASTDVAEKKPLSPKKDGQNLPLSRDVGSDDELATYEKTPLKPLMKSPVKGPSTVRKLDLHAPEKDEDGDAPQAIEQTLPSGLSSPARRPPPSPFKDMMKSPAKRVDSVPSLLLPSTSTEVQGAQSPSKPTLLQSPAKRPHAPLQTFQLNQEQVGAVRSPMKMSFLGTPAKRPVSPLKLLGPAVSLAKDTLQEAPKENTAVHVEEEDDAHNLVAKVNDADTPMEEEDDANTTMDEGSTCTLGDDNEYPETPTKKEHIYTPMKQITEEELQSQIRKEIGFDSPTESAAVEKGLSPIQEVDNEDSIQSEQLKSPTPQLAFPGRLSAVLPRHADPALNQGLLSALDLPVPSQTDVATPQKSASRLARLSPDHETSHDIMDNSQAMPEKQTAESRVTRLSPDHEFSHDILDTLPAPEKQTVESRVTRKSPDHESSHDIMDSSQAAESRVTRLSPDHESSHDIMDTSPTPEKQTVESRVTRKSPDHETSHDIMDSSQATPEKQISEICAAGSENGWISAPATKPGMQVTHGSGRQSGQSEANSEEPAVSGPTQTTPLKGARKRAEFGLRGKHLEDDGMSDSEDELALSNRTTTKFQNAIPTNDPQPSTPVAPLFKTDERKLSESVIRAATRAIRSLQKPIGYSMPLGAWRASSPLKARQAQQNTASQVEDDEDEYSLVEDDPVAETPAVKGFFDDEMKIRADMENQAAMEAFLEADIAAKFDKHNFHDLGLMEQDTSLVADNDGMSLLNTRETDQSHFHEESASEASQEYGDENAIPIDPALMNTNKLDTQAGIRDPVTPLKRTFASREFHTVSKVPLKRGDDSPPRSVKRLCSTVSKASLQRPGPFSNVSVPSQRYSQMGLQDQTDVESSLAAVTPAKPAPWSSLGTPARATRPDLNSKLLNGAIIFVDVHTTEGADAGRIFVDLLIQMGARCVKSWPWNPNHTMDGQADASKIGITHVVFKDGGKRTLEKVIESNGAVQCVGVSWVLDCEKENRWLDEKDYRVDTALIPRGGHNRRKSMEPKAIANMNGTLVTPMKANPGTFREPQTVPNNYMSRRDSTIWMCTPSDHDEDEDAPSEPSEMDWESTNAPILTPVPHTPAPEMVARFAMEISPGTPTMSSLGSTPATNQPLMQTCPPKQSGLTNIGEGLVSNQDPISVRLMAARRKSMQFAPKVASPLKQQWKQMD